MKAASGQVELYLPPPESGPAPSWSRFPKTRYMGSKRKLLGLLHAALGRVEFETALDPFSGTGAAAYLLKTMGAAVTACDVLESNATVARALIANREVRLGETVDELVADPSPGRAPGFVERTFAGVFFEDEENRFIDAVLERIARLDGHRRDIALYALFQAALAKRPYNLFHRANLYMRRRKVERSFGNKTTWETPFSVHIRRNAAEADAAIFDNGRPCRALRADVLEIDPTGYDLVYLDPPYVSATGKGVDYLDYYHFLEGLCAPEGWGDRILHRYKHKPLVGRGESPWTKPAEIGAVFERAIAHYRASTLVISYRADGIPTVDEISAFLARAGKRITIIDSGKYTYALSRNRRSREIVLIGA